MFTQSRFAGQTATPSSVTGPGVPNPIPVTSSLEIPFSSNFANTEAAMSGRTWEDASSLRVGICHLSNKDVVRHPLVQEIIKAYARFDEEKEKRNGRANNRKRTE